MWAVCCSVLQCVAVCCSVLQQCVAVCCIADVSRQFQHFALYTVCCSVGCSAVCYSVLQCGLQCSVLQCVSWARRECGQCVADCCRLLQIVAVCCSMLQCGLQCIEACCRVSQCVAVCYSVLQWVHFTQQQKTLNDNRGKTVSCRYVCYGLLWHTYVNKYIYMCTYMCMLKHKRMHTRWWITNACIHILSLVIRIHTYIHIYMYMHVYVEAETHAYTMMNYKCMHTYTVICDMCACALDSTSL